MVVRGFVAAALKPFEDPYTSGESSESGESGGGSRVCGTLVTLMGPTGHKGHERGANERRWRVAPEEGG